MDSLTQIVLGAAVGELCLGKKIGNRAMLWGAIGGTIPDLDVGADFFLSEIDALVFHRSATHSILFSISFAWIMAVLCRYIYTRQWYLNKSIRWIFYIVIILLLGGSLFGLNFIVHQFSSELNIGTIAISMIVLIYFGWRHYQNYLKFGTDIENPRMIEWYGLFFWAFFTHIILDSFTAYGTQLFWPFSNWRVAFNNISVVDPLYTLPFLLLLLAASFFYRKRNWRYKLNLLGIILSSGYIIFSLFNHFQVTQIFKSALEKEQIQYERLLVTPTILNNALWNGIAQRGDQYFYSRYSILQDKKEILGFKQIHGNHHLLEPYADYYTIKKLRWFSNEYFMVSPMGRDSGLHYTDLRYGTLNHESEDSSEFVFRFQLIPNSSTHDFDMSTSRPTDGNDDTDLSAAFKNLWYRIWYRDPKKVD